MRVTNLMMVDSMKYNVNKNMSRLEQLQFRTAQGKKFRYPSDNPIAVSRSLKYNTDISKGVQHLSNVEDTVSWMTTTEAALNEVKEIMHRTNELIVQAANGTNIKELDKIKAEIKELRGSLLHMANTSYAGRRLFSGFQTDTDLLDKDGNYNIDLDGTGPAGIKLGDGGKEVFLYNTGVAENVEVNTLGSQIFGVITGEKDRLDEKGNPVLDKDGNVIKDKDFKYEEIDTKKGDKPYLIHLMDKLSKDLDEMNQEELRHDIQLTKEAFDNAVSVNAEFGARVNRMHMTKIKLEDSIFNLQTLMSDNENVDLAEAFTSLLTEENVYRASLGVTGRIIQPTLMDFLR